MKNCIRRFKNHIAAPLSAAKDLAQNISGKACHALAKSYVKRPALTMLSLRFAPRAVAVGAGLFVGAFSLEGLLNHDFFLDTASAAACQTGYYETDVGHISGMDYSNGPDGMHGTGDDILQVRGLTNYPIDFRAEDGIPPETLQKYNDDFNSGDYVKVGMCTNKGGILGGGILNRTHYGVSMEHLAEPKQDNVDDSLCLAALAIGGAVILGGVGLLYGLGRLADWRQARRYEQRNKNSPETLEKIDDDGFEEIKKPDEK
ncbi:MAG: hypothetical protein HY438_02150 [DPANN group archaeon]|nr:hypothetical protein [DPANN group archaeon]